MACDEESYNVFSELFDPLVKQHHSKFQMDLFKFEPLELVSLESKLTDRLQGLESI